MLVPELIHFLSALFDSPAYPPDEQGGFYFRPDQHLPNAPVQRLGLALEPGPDLPDWISKNRIGTLWLHRPWQLDPAVLPTHIPVLFHHLPFDEHLTIGYNRLLANTLSMPWTATEMLGTKQAPGFPARPIGMIGTVPERDFASWCAQFSKLFGGYEDARPGTQDVPGRMAVVGAMNNELIREAACRGAGLYVTGQYRKGAQKAVDETGMAVMAVGHRRSEEWGLRMLAEVLRKENLDVVVKPY
ncbi:Nif3-like dinuclear metal center hexameric protein [Larkinella ripae]